MKPQTYFTSLGQYHDHWASVLLCAPDRFHVEDWDQRQLSQRERLDEAFELLRSGFPFAEKKLAAPRHREICRELLKMSYEAYVAGDSKLGAHTLQEAEGMIWPGRASRLKHVVEAERRAFGEVVLYKDVVVSPYPCEGTEADLGEIQRRLWKHATSDIDGMGHVIEGLTRSWAMHRDGSIRATKGRSMKALRLAFRDGAASGELIGIVTAQLLPGGSLLCVDVEEAGKPLASIRRLTEGSSGGQTYFHLDEPVAFTSR